MEAEALRREKEAADRLRAEELARMRSEEELGRKAEDAEQRAAKSQLTAAQVAAATAAGQAIDEEVPRILGGGLIAFIAGCGASPLRKSKRPKLPLPLFCTTAALDSDVPCRCNPPRADTSFSTTTTPRT